jgi:hypothetical protein
MKLDPGMHIVMHLVFFRKIGVTLGQEDADCGKGVAVR